jgi:hypothetical protein
MIYDEIKKNRKKIVYKKEVKLELTRIIGDACGSNGYRYKMNIQLQELISYKMESDEERFKAYVCSLDQIKEMIQMYLPFVDVSIIDLSWTANEIIKEIILVYDNAPVKEIIRHNKC